MEEADAPLEPKREPPAIPTCSFKDAIREALRLTGCIVIDCAYDHLMKDTEKSGLVHQICLSYGETTNAKLFKGLGRVPMDLAKRTRKLLVCGLKELPGTSGPLLGTHNRTPKGMEKWEMVFTTKTLEELVGTTLRKEDLVYLTHDSTQTLISPNHTTPQPPNTVALSNNIIPVIGGLVDRNRHKGVSAKRAGDMELRTARLPLEGVEVKKQVMTVNQVVAFVIGMLNK